MDLTTSRILITGGTGAIGKQLIYELVRRGLRPIVHCRESSDTAAIDRYGLEKRFADLRQTDQLRQVVGGVDGIIHTAAMVNFRQDRLTQFTGLNTIGAIDLFRAAGEAGVKRFVQVSSVVAVGAQSRGRDQSQGAKPLSEEAPFNLGHLRIPYIMSKRAAEDQLLELAGNSEPELVIVNPSIVVAPSRRGYDRAVADRLFGRPLLPVFDGSINLVDLRDVAPAIIAALAVGRPGERYLLTGENIPIRDLIERVGAIVGRKPLLIRPPLWLLRLAARLAVSVNRFRGRAKVSFYPDLVRLLDYSWVYTSDKARQELGFRARPVAETLGDLLADRFPGSWREPAA
jgi:dihydroflavonol-4-reductase